MKCPHCLDSIHSNPRYIYIGQDESGEWHISSERCPECEMIIIKHLLGKGIYNGGVIVGVDAIRETIINPKIANRNPCPVEVPERIANDYKEASLVLSDSPKASAALSRRCLQNILIEAEGVKGKILSNDIQEVIDKQKIPSQISDALDTVREIGNFAAHPTKSTSSGEIIDVEEHEAEWNLDVIESLFDFYYVAPQKMKIRKDKLNAKLKDAGKKQLK